MTFPLIIAIFLILVLLSYLFHIIYIYILEPGAIYYPTTDKNVDKMLQISKITSKDTIVDLGSGDGRILIAAAKLGAKAIGYETNPVLVYKSRKLAKNLKLDHLIKIHQKSLWHADFNQATIITLYLFPNLMNRLQKVLEKKLTHPLKLVSNIYQFPHKKPIKQEKDVFLYRF